VKGQCFPNNKRTEDRIKGYYKDIWHIQREVETTNEGEHHETVKKPFVVMLPLYHFTKEGDTILDPFAGSGTTGVACKKLNRNCIMIEIEPKHCEIIKKRIFNTQTDMFCGVEK
jgi:DNA modification methylase